GRANCTTVTHQVDAEHLGGPGSQRQESGAEPEERGLPGTVRTRDEDDLPLLHVEIRTREGRKSTEHADGRAKADDAQKLVPRGEGAEPPKATDGLRAGANRPDRRIGRRRRAVGSAHTVSKFV